MDLATIDTELGQWRDRLVRLSRNVSELTELPEYVVLRNRLRGLVQPPLVGCTKEAALRLVASGDELAASVGLLGRAIDRADGIRSRARNFLFNGDECARQAKALLDGNTIEVVLADVPVLDRDALGGAQDIAMVSADTLIKAIQGGYRAVSATLRQVDGAEQRLGEMLRKAEAEAAEFRDAECSRRIAELSALAGSDPLAAMEAAERDVLPVIEAARGRTAAARATVAACQGELAAARADLRTLGTLAREAAAAADACRAVVSDCVLPDPMTEQGRELPGWLDRIADKLAGGNPAAFRPGLASWRILFATVSAAQAALKDASTRAVERREELRGRYGALRAKHAALEARGTLPPDAGTAGDMARAVLFGTATCLAEAERLTSAYEATLARAPRA